MDHYQTLGVAKTATQDEIKQAYRKLAQKHHPDRENGSEEKFKDLQKAYSAIKTPEKRAEYDNPQPEGFTFRTGDMNVNMGGFGGMTPEDIIAELHRGGFGQRRQQRPMAKVVITLEEAYTGTTRTLNSNEFSIPRGVRTGNKLAIDNTIVVVQVQGHRKFQRANDNLVVGVEVTAIEAIAGVSCQITGLDGKTIKFNIPAGTQYGQVIRLKGKGMPNPELNFLGDLLIQVGVSVPDNLTDEELESIMKLPRRDSITI